MNTIALRFNSAAGRGRSLDRTGKLNLPVSPGTESLVTLWLLEVNDIGQSVAKERALPKTGCECKARNGIASLKVRIEDDLDDCQETAGLQCLEQFGDSGRAICDLSKDSHQDGPAKPIVGKRPVAAGGSDKFDVCAPYLASATDRPRRPFQPAGPAGYG